MEYVHQACLKRWVLHSGRLFCQVCLFKYKLAKETTPLNQILKNLRTTAESQKCLFRLKLRALEYGGWLALFLLYYLVIHNFYGFDITAAISLSSNVSCQWTYFNLSVQQEQPKEESPTVPYPQEAPRVPMQENLQQDMMLGPKPEFFFGLFFMLIWSSVLVKYAVHLLGVFWKDLVWCRRQRCRKRFLDVNYQKSIATDDPIVSDTSSITDEEEDNADEPLR